MRTQAFPLRVLRAHHGGRCTLCQRGHAAGWPIVLAHGCPFCLRCVEGRYDEVQARIAEARRARGAQHD